MISGGQKPQWVSREPCGWLGGCVLRQRRPSLGGEAIVQLLRSSPWGENHPHSNGNGETGQA